MKTLQKLRKYKKFSVFCSSDEERTEAQVIRSDQMQRNSVINLCPWVAVSSVNMSEITIGNTVFL